MKIGEVTKLYEVELWTLRRIADHFGTNHHRIKNMLIANGVQITNQKRFAKPFSEERKKAVGDKSRGRIAWNKGERTNESSVRKMMKGRMRTKIDLDAYPDLYKLQFLVKLTSRHFQYLGCTDEKRKAFLDKFYFDPAFNTLYDKWQESGEDKWLYPSIDHMVSKNNGGTFELSNLQFITWFENRAKADMNHDEWEEFKKATNTKSDLFV